MKIYFIIFFVLFFSIACNSNHKKYKKQLEVTQLLLQRIKNQDTSSIMKMLGANPSDIGMDTQRVYSIIQKINKLIIQSRIAGEKAYEFQEYPSDSPNLVDIIIPFSDSIKGQSIFISFVKYIEDGKILYFSFSENMPHNYEDLPTIEKRSF